MYRTSAVIMLTAALTFRFQMNGMKYNLRKSLVLLVISLVVAFSISWKIPLLNQDDGRNLKVLPKDISPDSLERVMDEFVTALSVDCGFCHAPKDPAVPKKLDYASDANPHKNITRSMMQMTTDINNRYIKNLPGQAVKLVNCNTCHRGESVPGVK